MGCKETFEGHHFRKGRCRHIPARRGLIHGEVDQVLRQVTDAYALFQVHRAARGSQLPEEDAEKACFPGAVFAHECDAVAGMNGKGYAVQDLFVGKSEMDVVPLGEHGKTPLSRVETGTQNGRYRTAL